FHDAVGALLLDREDHRSRQEHEHRELDAESEENERRLGGRNKFETANTDDEDQERRAAIGHTGDGVRVFLGKVESHVGIHARDPCTLEYSITVTGMAYGGAA